MLEALFTDYTLRTVALGSASLGLVSGALGSFAMLRRQSLLGDAISHAALPGVAVAFLLTGSKAPLVLVLGAALATSAAAMGAGLHILMHALGKITLFFVAGADWRQFAIAGIVVALWDQLAVGGPRRRSCTHDRGDRAAA